MVSDSVRDRPVPVGSTTVGPASLLPSAIVGGLSAATAFALGAIDVLDEPVAFVLALALGAGAQFALRANASPAPASGGLDQHWHELALELDRARRHERPVAIIRLAAPAEAGREPGEWQRQLAPHLRSIDRTWLDGEWLYILLPESDRVAGEAMLARIRRLGPGWLTDLTMSVFPEDGITTAALLSALRGRPVAGPPLALRSSRPPDDRFRKAG